MKKFKEFIESLLCPVHHMPPKVTILNDLQLQVEACCEGFGRHLDYLHEQEKLNPGQSQREMDKMTGDPGFDITKL